MGVGEGVFISKLHSCPKVLAIVFFVHLSTLNIERKKRFFILSFLQASNMLGEVF